MTAAYLTLLDGRRVPVPACLRSQSARLESIVDATLIGCGLVTLRELKVDDVRRAQSLVAERDLETRRARHRASSKRRGR